MKNLIPQFNRAFFPACKDEGNYDNGNSGTWNCTPGLPYTITNQLSSCEAWCTPDGGVPSVAGW